MRLLFVIQRYGAEVAGGAEQHCRSFATRLAARGHTVEVLAAADGPQGGQAVEEGVTVHRLGMGRPVDAPFFERFTQQAIYGHPPPPLVLQELWLDAQGPDVVQLEGWLAEQAGRYDVAIFFTYLFRTFWSGLPVAARQVPVVAHATAHDEPYLWLPAFDTVLRLPDVYAWSTEEEGDLLRRRGDGRRPGMVMGVGIDAAPPGIADRFRRAVPALGDRPYLLYLGRVTAGKGALELYHWFTTYKRRRPGPLALAFVGAADVDLPAHPDVFSTGFVAHQLRIDALAGALALVNPSPFESFSLVLCEAWAQGRPVIVQGRSDVLAGQARRSGGGLAYHGYGEWEAALELLTERKDAGDRLGAAGRRYVHAHYDWEWVLDRYERLLSLACRLHAERA